MVCIFAVACSERENVRIDISLPFARTVICAVFAFITKPSNLLSPVGLGFTAFTIIGPAVSITIGATVAGDWAWARGPNLPVAATGDISAAVLGSIFIPS